jgi:hypothetical protein
LCATSLIQQLNRRLRNSLTPDNDIQPLSDLVETQLAIETGTIDLEAAMNRVVSLAMKLGRATGVATWLFTGQEFVYRAGTGTAANSNDERLQLEVLSKLVSICGASDHSTLDPRKSNDWSPARTPFITQALLSPCLLPHISRAESRRGISGLLPRVQCLTGTTPLKLVAVWFARLCAGQSSGAEPKQNVSLERAAMLQVIDQLMPALRAGGKDKPESRRSSIDSFRCH